MTHYGVYVIDLDGGIVSWNAGAERLTGYLASELIGQRASVFVDDADSTPEFEVTLRYATEHGWYEHDAWRLRKDGSRFWANIVLTAIHDGTGLPTGFVTIMRDLAEGRYAEELVRGTEAKLAGIIESAMDAIITINEAQRIVVFNAAAEFMFGYSQAEAIGRSIHQLLPPRFRGMHEQHIREFGSTGVTTRSMGALRPLAALRADGTEFPIEAAISQVEVGGQKLFSVILRDVSERKRAEAEREELWRAAERQAIAMGEQAERLEIANQELLRLATKAAEANRAKSDFLAIMSHELRTPLNAIAGYTELLELGIRGPVTADQLADLHRIRRSQQHLLTLINEVLDFAKLETGRVEYDFREFPICEVLTGLEILMQPQIRAKQLTFTYTRTDPELLAYGDSDKVQQILLNLLSNAVKFTPSGGTITLSCTAADTEYVKISVRDTGCGIVAHKLDVIFEPFIQVDGRLTREWGGVGLGLAISRDLAQAMHATLTVESEVGIGTTFVLTMPQRAPVVAGRERVLALGHDWS